MALNTTQSGIGMIDPKSWKEAVSLATTGTIALTGIVAVDGVTTTTGMRVLVKDQNPGGEHIDNGIYVANDAGAWTRAVDASINPQFAQGIAVSVIDGATNARLAFVCDAFTVTPVNLGSTVIGFSRLGLTLDDQADFTESNQFAQSFVKNKYLIVLPDGGPGPIAAVLNTLLQVNVLAIDILVNLPQITLANKGQSIIIKNTNGSTETSTANLRTVPFTAQTVDGQSAVQNPGMSGPRTVMHLISDGVSNWINLNIV